jgi:tetratricopeptide (TPR) repeat protein
MGALFRSSAICILVQLTTNSVGAQPPLPQLALPQLALPPALEARFSQAVADLKAGRLDAAERALRAILRDGGERAFVHHNLGIVLRERGRHADALGEFRAAAKIDPSFGPARLLAGTSLVALGRAREARTELEVAVRLMPRETAAHLELAEACQRLDDRLCVVDACSRVVQLAPDDPEHAYRLGAAYLRLAEWSHEQIAKTSPGSARQHQALAREYQRQGRSDLAAGALQRAVKADPALPELHLALARIHLAQGQLEEARRELASELAIVPSSADALALKARTEGGPREPFTPPASIDVAPSTVPPSAVRRDDIDAAIRGREWDRAERLLSEEIERQPQSRELLTLVARIFFVDGKPLNTAVALKKAEAIAPLDRDLRFLLVLAYVRLGRRDWARPELERLAQGEPNTAEYRYWIGRLDYDDGKYADAIARFKEALVLDPGFARAHDNLGLCYEALDQTDNAIVHYREALRLNRQSPAKSPWPPTNLGILLRQRGELEESAALFREALTYDGKFAKAHCELGILLDQQGRTNDALRELGQAVAIDASFAEPHYVLARIYRRQGKTALADAALATFLRLRTSREQNQGGQR